MATHQKHGADKPKEVAKQRPKAEPAPQEPVVLPELPASTLLQRAVTRPRLVTPGGVQAMQRAYGNRAVDQLIQRQPPEEDEGLLPGHSSNHLHSPTTNITVGSAKNNGKPVVQRTIYKSNQDQESQVKVFRDDDHIKLEGQVGSGTEEPAIKASGSVELAVRYIPERRLSAESDSSEEVRCLRVHGINAKPGGHGLGTLIMLEHALVAQKMGIKYIIAQQTSVKGGLTYLARGFTDFTDLPSWKNLHKESLDYESRISEALKQRDITLDDTITLSDGKKPTLREAFKRKEEISTMLGKGEMVTPTADLIRLCRQKMTKYNWSEVPSGKCYITTACVEFMGLDDDCEELTVLRNFRDTYLASRNNGPELIQSYYQNAPKIVSNIRRREDKEEIFIRLYKIIRQCVDAIKEGDNEFAFHFYCRMVVDLKRGIYP
jgi:hypothetical protein